MNVIPEEPWVEFEIHEQQQGMNPKKPAYWSCRWHIKFTKLVDKPIQDDINVTTTYSKA